MAEKRGTLSTIDYVTDYEYSVQMARWFLNPISVWPLSPTISMQRKILSECVTFLCSILIVCMFVPGTLGTIMNEETNTEGKLRDVGPLGFWLLGGMKYFSLLAHVNDIRGCMEHMKTDWKTVKRIQDRQEMLRNAKIGRFVAGFCAVCMNSGVISYHIARTVTPIVSFVENDSVPVRLLPYTFYDRIWDPRFSPAYEIIFAVQCLSAFVVTSVTVGTCGLAAILVMHARGQLRVLISLLDDLVGKNEEDHGNVQRRMGVIVEHHLRVLSFTSSIEEIMHLICLVEILGSMLFMCLLGYCGITEWNLNERQNILAYCIIFLSISFNIFVYCCIGEVLTDQSKQVGVAAYMTDWYHLPGKTAIGLILIILRSSSVIKITAGKLVPLSLPLYSDILKTSLTYLNMLRALTCSIDA